jgi:hypothetical protein
VTLIKCRAEDWIVSYADSRLAGVGLGAKIGIVTGHPVWFGRIRADTGGRVAYACHVTLVEGSADDGIHAAAHAVIAHVDSRAEITIVAGRVFG